MLDLWNMGTVAEVIDSRSEAVTEQEKTVCSQAQIKRREHELFALANLILADRPCLAVSLGVASYKRRPPCTGKFLNAASSA